MPSYNGHSPSVNDHDDPHRHFYPASDEEVDDHNYCDDAPYRHRSSLDSEPYVASHSPGRNLEQYQFGAQEPQQYAHTVPADWGVPPGIDYGSPMAVPIYTHGRRNSITISEASTGASSEYRGEGYLNTFDYFGTDDVAHSGYMPVGSIQDNFGPSTPFDIIPGPSSQIVSTHNRIVRETLFKNKHAHVLCMTIIEIMSKIRLRVSHAGIVEDVNPVDRDNVFAELEAFAAAAAPELQNWIRAGSQRRVGTNANIRVATARRSNRNGTQLFLCTWCGLVTTTKNNLGNHIRSHLGFHISFCDHCPFSSVTSRIPDRHRASCGRRTAGM
ncbi:hypothetical protein BJ165DRAFT_1401135 [Panaeolus papilionaceus]|nr:hypothetical protein BJ165DRAFT_1401135 [Panaeolus papilionaceus]